MDQYVLGNTPSYGVNGSFLGGASAGYQLNTTSQPVATSPVATLFQGLGASSGLLQAAQAVGIVPAELSQYVTNYLQGTGSLTTAQQGYARQYLTGLLGSVSAQVTEYQPDGTSRLITLQAPDVGITSANLPTITQQYLNNGAGLTERQTEFMNALNKQIPNYVNAVAAPDSTYIDRTNPANAVATGRAGETGLNQARALIETFERLGTARTLVETTLTSVSGEGASYLAGGRYPVPSGRDNQGNVMTEFQPYGVGLGFTPMVLDGGRISLKASIEVSELTNQGALTLAGVGGTGTSTVIPALAVTKVDNTMELPSGGSMMIAGMLRETTRQNLDKVPGIEAVPVFGALARSRDFLKNETELVIIVTPYLVKPAAPGQLQTPADGMRIASDSSANLLGRVNQPYKASPDEPPTAIASRRYEGPIGHVID
jgi:Flp pilus assembly secretin CpaC